MVAKQPKKPKYKVSAAVGGPSYAWDYMTKKKEVIGKEYVEFPFNTKKSALKFAYQISKKTEGKAVFLWAMSDDPNWKHYYCWGQVNYSENPKAWFYKKVMFGHGDPYVGNHHLKSDGTLGKSLNKPRK